MLLAWEARTMWWSRVATFSISVFMVETMPAMVSTSSLVGVSIESEYWT